MSLKLTLFKSIYDDILENYLVLSEFELKTKHILKLYLKEKM